MQAVEKQEDLDKLNAPAGNANQQMKQKLNLRKNECLKTEDDKIIEEKHKKDFSSEETSNVNEMPIKR